MKFAQSISQLPVLKALMVLVFATACAANEPQERGSAAQLTIITGEATHNFRVEIADDDEERRVGLMFRNSLAPDAGMLFDFEQSRPLSMWMKNTLISLDMAFIDETGEIRRIATQTTPRSLESITSGEPVLAVLEVAGGTFERLDIQEGDRVVHQIFNNK